MSATVQMAAGMRGCQRPSTRRPSILGEGLDAELVAGMGARRSLAAAHDVSHASTSSRDMPASHVARMSVSAQTSQ